jgi:hypothetical protein
MSYMKTLRKIKDFKLVKEVETCRYFMIHGNLISKVLSKEIKNMLLKYCSKGEFMFYGAIMTQNIQY